MAIAGCLPDLARAAQAQRTAARRALTQSVCRWCYRDIPLRDFCQAAAKMGLPAIDLLTPEEWPVPSPTA
jgi:hydroxypyruvate isomerase